MTALVRSLLAALAGLVVVLAALPALAQPGPTFPPLTGRVIDEAALLDDTTEASLTRRLAALEADTGDQLVVVTVPTLQDYEIEEYGYRLGRAWGIGQSETDSGVLLIVAPTERRVRLEVGYGLEPILTDAFSSEVIQTVILPQFKRGAFQPGIVEGVEAVETHLRLDPAEAQARAAAVEPQKASAPIGPAIVVFLVLGFLLLGLISSLGRRGRRRRGGVSPAWAWVAADVLTQIARSRGGSGGGGFSSGGGGFRSGGGFSGGGGSFGGGGASGGW